MFLNWQEQQKHWRYFLRAEVQFGEQFKTNPMVTCSKSFSFWNSKSERVNFLVQKYIVTNLAISLDRLIFQTGTPHVEGPPSLTWWLNLETDRRCCFLRVTCNIGKRQKCQTLRKFWHLELFLRDLHVIWHLVIFRADQLKKPPCIFFFYIYHTYILSCSSACWRRGGGETSENSDVG